MSFFRKLKLRIQILLRVVLVLTKIETRFNRKLAGLSAKGGNALATHKQASSSPFLQRYFQGNLWGSPVLEVAGSTKGKLTRYLLKLIREVPALASGREPLNGSLFDFHLRSTDPLIWDPPLCILRFRGSCRVVRALRKEKGPFV